MRKILIDAHTHTVASGHAYSSLQEMAKAAADKGLEVLGITEHGPSVPGTCPTLYFKNMFVVPRRMYGIRLLMGCEINILDTKGSLDLTDEQIGWLDLAIAGIHAAWYQGGTKEENTEGMIQVIKNPKIHIISHPGDGSCELDFEPLVLAAKEAHTLLEVNNHSLAPQRHKTVARDNNLDILRLCKKYEVPTILGSDAHISFQIADYERLYPLLSETDFPSGDSEIECELRAFCSDTVVVGRDRKLAAEVADGIIIERDCQFQFNGLASLAIAEIPDTLAQNGIHHRSDFVLCAPYGIVVSHSILFAVLR